MELLVPLLWGECEGAILGAVPNGVGDVSVLASPEVGTAAELVTRNDVKALIRESLGSIDSLAICNKISPVGFSTMHVMVAWDDVKGPASKIFDIWSSGGDLEWAQEAWAHFEKAGLTSINSHVDRTRITLRLMILGKIYEEFCVARWEEDPDRSLAMIAESLDIDRLSLGVLAGMAGCKTADNGHLFDADNDDELYDNALRAASAHLREEIFTCLRDAYGDENKLYARLCKTSLGLIPPDDVSHENPFDLTARNLDAYDAFVANRFR